MSLHSVATMSEFTAEIRDVQKVVYILYHYFYCGFFVSYCFYRSQVETHVIYLISVGVIGNTAQCTVGRRFSEFLDLYKQLCTVCPDMKTFEFPAKASRLCL